MKIQHTIFPFVLLLFFTLTIQAQKPTISTDAKKNGLLTKVISKLIFSDLQVCRFKKTYCIKVKSIITVLQC